MIMIRKTQESFYEGFDAELAIADLKAVGSC